MKRARNVNEARGSRGRVKRRMKTKMDEEEERKKPAQKEYKKE